MPGTCYNHCSGKPCIHGRCRFKLTTGGRCCRCVGESGSVRRQLCWEHKRKTKQLCPFRDVPDIPRRGTVDYKILTVSKTNRFFKSLGKKMVANKKHIFNDMCSNPLTKSASDLAWTYFRDEFNGECDYIIVVIPRNLKRVSLKNLYAWGTLAKNENDGMTLSLCARRGFGSTVMNAADLAMRRAGLEYTYLDAVSETLAKLYKTKYGFKRLYKDEEDSSVRMRRRVSNNEDASNMVWR